MEFDVTVGNQMECVDTAVKLQLYRYTHLGAKKAPIVIRLLGVGVGVAEGALTVTKQVALIAEALLKGGLNIIGSPFVQECSFFRGVGMVIFSTTGNLIALPFTLISAAINVIGVTILLAKDPVQGSHARWMHYDPQEHRAETERRAQQEVEREQEKKRQEQKQYFENNERNLQQSPNNPIFISIAAECYLEGKGVEKDVSKGIELLQKLVDDHQSGEAAVKLATLYQQGTLVPQDNTKAFNYAEQAAKFKSPQGAYLCGLMTKESDLDRAIERFTQAALDKHEQASFDLGEIYLTDAKWDHKKAAQFFYLADHKKPEVIVHLKALGEHFSAATQDFIDAEVPETLQTVYTTLCSRLVANGGFKPTPNDRLFMDLIIRKAEYLNRMAKTLGNTGKAIDTIRDTANNAFHRSQNALPLSTSPLALLAKVREKHPTLDLSEIDQLPIFFVDPDAAMGRHL